MNFSNLNNIFLWSSSSINSTVWLHSNDVIEKKKNEIENTDGYFMFFLNKSWKPHLTELHL